MAQRLRLKNPVDFRLLALMAFFPDIVDRALSFLIVPEAQKGRLIAPTAVFQLASLSALVAIRRSFWFYGVASLAHLALDAQGLPTKHAFWPLLGSELENVNIVRGSAGAAGQSFGERVLGRLKVITNTYSKADMRAILLECGGLAPSVVFFFPGYAATAADFNRLRSPGLPRSSRTTLRTHPLQRFSYQ